MAECAFMADCPFFNGRMASMPRVAEVYSKRYCSGDSSQCAIYIVSMVLGKEKIPEDLFPSQKERALRFISNC